MIHADDDIFLVADDDVFIQNETNGTYVAFDGANEKSRYRGQLHLHML